MIRLGRTKHSEVDVLLNIQKRAFINDYDKYQDHETNPYCETEQILLDSIKNDEFYTIYDKEKIVGAVVLKVVPKERIHIYKLFIDPEIQGSGYGTAAINRIFNLYQEVPLWTVYTPHGNVLNHKFYQKLGFIKYGEAEISDKLSLYKFKKEEVFYD